MKSREAGGAGFGGAIQADAIVLRKRVENPGAVQEFQIVEAFVARDFAAARDRDGAGQQQSAAIARIADAFRDAGGISNGGGFESVLQEDRAIEVFARERAPGGPLFAERFGSVGNHAVTERLAMVEIGHPGFRQNRDFSLRKTFAQRAQGGQGHNGVSQPVGGADQDAIIEHSS